MAAQLTVPREHPSMFVTAQPKAGLRSLEDLRSGITSGHGKILWEALLAQVDERVGTPVVAPQQMKDGEPILLNRSYDFVSKAANRILDTALVALVLDDRRYVDAVLPQIMALFDKAQWPEWSDSGSFKRGAQRRPAPWSTGLCPSRWPTIGSIPNLLQKNGPPSLKVSNRCAITPYKKGYAANEHWMRRSSNWMTVVLGGFGIAGMALGPDHPDSALLVANSLPMMEAYLDALGPEGEFNESVQYAGSMSSVVRYFMAMRYASGGEDNPFERHSLEKFYTWYMLMTFPPGRVAGFGDPAPDMPPVVVPVAAVASAMQNPQLQWFYEQYNEKMLASHRKRALELLYYDASLQGVSPVVSCLSERPITTRGTSSAAAAAGIRPVVFRWSMGSPVARPTTVTPIGGRCVSMAMGSDCSLILVRHRATPKARPSGTTIPAIWPQRVCFGENETGGVSLREKGRYGETVWSEFDPDRGAAWTMDLSHVYDEGTQVSLDRGPPASPVWPLSWIGPKLPSTDKISMRWHVGAETLPQEDGSFVVAGKQGTLVGRTMRLDGAATLTTNHHEYVAPYNTHRLGTEFKQRKEPFLDLQMTDDRCQLLSLFAVFETGGGHGALGIGGRWLGHQHSGRSGSCQNGRHTACSQGPETGSGRWKPSPRQNE